MRGTGVAAKRWLISKHAACVARPPAAKLRMHLVPDLVAFKEVAVGEGIPVADGAHRLAGLLPNDEEHAVVVPTAPPAQVLLPFGARLRPDVVELAHVCGIAEPLGDQWR